MLLSPLASAAPFLVLSAGVNEDLLVFLRFLSSLGITVVAGGCGLFSSSWCDLPPLSIHPPICLCPLAAHWKQQQPATPFPNPHPLLAASSLFLPPSNKWTCKGEEAGVLSLRTSLELLLLLSAPPPHPYPTPKCGTRSHTAVVVAN